MTESLDSAETELGPPGVFVRQRWISQCDLEWAREAEAILLKYERVDGQELVNHRHQARWRARRVIGLVVELRLYEGWEVSEHIERRPEGWAWSVVHVGPVEPRHP